jgi:hypothetical protein
MMMMGLCQLSAQSALTRLDKEDREFWTNDQIDLAYQPLEYGYDPGYTYIYFTTIKPLKARLWMHNFWFGSHPFDNRFHDLINQYIDDIEDLNIKLHNANYKIQKSRRKKIIISVASITTGLIVGTIGGVKIGIAISK